ncbi:hypothetical protein OGCDGJMD_00261 [Cyanobium usitatum str. Tous]|uniref:polysaccharide pyruvyl transferase family protein n=1 Tax=Cyanobium usitatum TaxID=2304190 RepID=UPI002AD46A3E|nr:polysaccharide pyruvyl transferase family protein [Cyanobium usitatum]CAK6687634.1 hypothetical protein OGCDGJMD_00261 [Cyanobium usitatum str. Tous]
MRIAHVAAFHKAGNAGDILLPAALQRLIESWSRIKIEWIEIQARDPVNSATIQKINSCDICIVGGGGLFLPDTNANDISGWQWAISPEHIYAIQVPLVLRGVGYNLFRNQPRFNDSFGISVAALAEKAVFIGLRNTGSIHAFRKHLPYRLHNKIRLDPCPTSISQQLFSPTIAQPPREPVVAINLAFDRSSLRFSSGPEEICHRIALALKRFLDINENLSISYYSHFDMDDIGYEHLKSAGLQIKFEDLSCLRSGQIVKKYAKPNLVIGMRGHSQLISLGCGTPCLSLISHDKLQWLLDDLNRQEWGIDISMIEASISGSELFCKLVEVRDQASAIHRDCALFHGQIRKVLDRNSEIAFAAI